MAKPLSEHKATLRGKKAKRGKAAANEPVHAIEYVPGGGVRRIVYEGDEIEREPQPEPMQFEEHDEPAVEFEEHEPEPEPAPAAHGDARDVIFNNQYEPQHLAELDHIRFEVDNLHMIKQQYRRGYAERQTDARWSRDVYRTDRGGVREAFAPSRDGESRVLYTTRVDGARERERRFSHADVDRAIAGVDLRETTTVKETVTEYETRKVRLSGNKDYAGDVHEVVDLEGIGPAYAERLHKAGIHNTQQLLFASTSALVTATGAPAKTVEQWKAMSQLVKVNGIGPQYAEALARSGITSIGDLKKRSAAKMADEVNEYLDSLKVNVLGQKVSEKRIAGWQAKAKPMRKVTIDMDNLKVRALESKAAIAGAKTEAAAEAAKAASKAKPKADAKARKAAAKPAQEAQCAAVTASGSQCSRASRERSKYCGIHKGYRA